MSKLIDLTGQRFGKLTVVSRANNNKNGKAQWNCVCDCGNTKIASASNLKNGNVKSCGCLMAEDLTGQKFGRLTVIKRTKNDKHGLTRWLCRCDCGNEKIVNAGSLKKGVTKSCGCLHKEVLSAMKKIHGMSKTRIASEWNDLKQRCYNPNNADYKNYGGRGITVCDEWRNDFQSFYEWAMANGYDDNLTIDRIDNNKGYSPDNCRWVDRDVQANNKRNNRRYIIDGKWLTVAQIAKIYNISRTTLNNRLKRGLSAEEAIKIPPKQQRYCFGESVFNPMVYGENEFEIIGEAN